MSDPIVEKGKVVSLAYRITDEHGELFEYRDIPVAYLHGSGSDLFPLIEQSLGGKKIGDHVPVTLPPEEGFGHHDPSLTFTDDIKNVPPEFHRIGAEVEMKNDRGEAKIFYVSKIEDDKLTVDGNHALAGQTVRFDVTITDIRDATEEELREGKPQGPAGGSPLNIQ